MLTVSTHFAPTDDYYVFMRMLNSVSFADKVLIFVYENHTNQEIKKLAKDKRIKIITIKPAKLVEEFRTLQVQNAVSEWVLILDFDEIVSPALKEEILESIKSKSSFSAFYINRENYSLGYRLKYGGWGNDQILRLFKVSDFNDWPKNIHSTPRFKGKAGFLKSPLEHHKDSSLSYMMNKTNRYSDAEAKLFFDGKMARVTSITLLRKPIMEFIRRYFFKLGFLDGKIGLIQSLYQSYSVFVTYAKLYELQS